MSLRIPRLPRIVSHAFGSLYTQPKAVEQKTVLDNQVVEAIMQSPWEMMQRSQKG